ncbi:HalOD1 output domain-containing protein [Natrinema sp. 1APR25-10V2]|uniref:HalOD1 output domain-containing protein n=1 Tax=Natrinema sp. 1APR25-10V2 TaxID=2951081 RepID=UPI0028745820|nr:HalOD1 output domain-containing protein [Natrinema sp. 1APR25-10V2]MDS0477059.1 hypothetical protein [Natrinema sp. 1APR25-10V2]
MVAEQLFLLTPFEGQDQNPPNESAVRETMTENGNERIYRFDFAADETATEAVIRGHATLRNKRPTDLSPLAEVIPCDALDTLVDAGDEVTVTFTYEGARTTIHGDEEIIVYDRE